MIRRWRARRARRSYDRWEADSVRTLHTAVLALRPEMADEAVVQFVAVPLPRYSRERLEAQTALLASVLAGLRGGSPALVFLAEMDQNVAAWRDRGVLT